MKWLGVEERRDLLRRDSRWRRYVVRVAQIVVLCYNSCMKEISVADAAWAAGFLDGEGSFGIHLRSESQGFTITVAATQTVERPLRKLQELFGGSVSVDRGVRFGSKTLYRYGVSSKKAAFLLHTIRPYLVVKDRQADVLLEARRLADERKLEGYGRDFTVEELTRIIALKASVMSLNRS
jgi:hypothetical protein